MTNEKEKTALATAITKAVRYIPPKPYNADTGKFNHEQIGEYITDDYKLFCLAEQGETVERNRLYRYIDEKGVYMNVTSELDGYMISLYPNITRTQRREVLSYIKAVAPIQSKKELNGEVVG